MKKTCKWMAKACLAGFLSFLIVSVFCYFYYNLPSRHIVSTGATDYGWSANHSAYRGTEGFAHTKTDEKGYINTFPEKKDTIDVLIMGSSHTEGFNVDYDENYTYLLNKAFYENGHNLYAYSIGVSDHALVRCFNNLESAVKEFSPAEYVVIETSTVKPDLMSLKQLDEGEYPHIPAYTSSLANYFQKSDFLRLAYAQISNLLEQYEEPALETDADDQEDYADYLEKMLKKGGEIAEQNGFKLVLMYSAALEFDYYGKVIAPQNTEDVARFKTLCQKYDIGFINMHTVYEAHYNETFQLPHGFSNSPVGEGHTNKYGHACMAEELYGYLTGGEEQ